MNEQLRVYDNLVDAIGKTPLVRIQRSLEQTPAKVYAKLEGYNPGLSSKDRTVLFMINDALSHYGGDEPPTMIEATSGNTGFSLAQICAFKGLNCILTVPNKISQEKLDALKAMGARVYVCPKTIRPEDPESYYSKAAQLHAEIPNSIFLNQYYNKSNIRAHYESTGPELWNQTEGKITHFLAGVGTGGTVSGVAKYLKEKNSDIQIIGVDAYGSVLTKYHETGEIDYDESYGYNIEGIGKNFIPANIDFPMIDRFIQVDDVESAYRARALAEQDGILVGYSGGAVMKAVDTLLPELKETDMVVALIADHGLKYLSKIYNDQWLQAKGLKKPGMQNQSEQA